MCKESVCVCVQLSLVCVCVCLFMRVHLVSNILASGDHWSVKFSGLRNFVVTLSALVKVNSCSCTFCQHEFSLKRKIVSCHVKLIKCNFKDLMVQIYFWRSEKILFANRAVHFRALFLSFRPLLLVSPPPRAPPPLPPSHAHLSALIASV